MKIEAEARIVRWGKDYILVLSNGDALKGLVDKAVRLTIVSDVGVYSMKASVSKTKQYSAIIYLPKRMAPTWEKLHEKVLKVIIEVGGGDGNC